MAKVVDVQRGDEGWSSPQNGRPWKKRLRRPPRAAKPLMS